MFFENRIFVLFALEVCLPAMLPVWERRPGGLWRNLFYCKENQSSPEVVQAGSEVVQNPHEVVQNIPRSSASLVAEVVTDKPEVVTDEPEVVTFRSEVVTRAAEVVNGILPKQRKHRSASPPQSKICVDLW